MLVLALAAAYVRGRRLAPRGNGGRRSWRCAGFAVLALSVSPAAHVLAARGLEPHMAQHVALVIAAAPLLVLGRRDRRCCSGFLEARVRPLSGSAASSRAR